MNEILLAYAWVDTTPDFANLPEQTTLEVDGVIFRIKNDYDKLSTDEIIYIEELIQDTRIDAHHFEIAFGVLFRKIDEQGNEVDLTLDGLFEQIKSFRSKVYLKDVFGVLSFFLSGDKEQYLKTSLSYSTNHTAKAKTKMKLNKTKVQKQEQQGK